MTDRRYTNPRTGEVIDYPEVRPFGVKLVEPDREVERAFAEVVDDIQGRIDVRVNHGIG